MLILHQGSHLLPPPPLSTLDMLGISREASNSIHSQSTGARISCQLDATLTHQSSMGGEGSWPGGLAP